jgi:hypothetical protein
VPEDRARLPQVPSMIAAPGFPARMTRLCATAAGSMSAYTTRAAGLACWATSCTLPSVGIPEPMSRNWPMPAWPPNRTARRKNARLARASTATFGSTAASDRPSFWSTGKLWSPPSR